MSAPETFAIRSFREGDEEALARLFNGYLALFLGPIRVTPHGWRDQYRREAWTGPSVSADADCVRVAERGGAVIGYAVTDYSPFHTADHALVQEICVADGDDADAVVEALLADAEERARERDRASIEIGASLEDGRVASAAAAQGYEADSGADGVFMAAVLDINPFLAEIEGELRRRIGQSAMRGWKGLVKIAGGNQVGLLRLSEGEVTVEPGRERQAPDVSATIDSDALPLLLMGRASAGELYLQDMLALEAADREEALLLFAALFPRLPACLPRAQWW
jgi:hypothetical protein